MGSAFAMLVALGPFIVIGVIVIALVKATSRSGPRPAPLERHRIDSIAFVAGLLTVCVGGVGLAHQLGAIELGPAHVAVIVTALIAVAIIATIVVMPRRQERIEDPRLARDAAKAAQD